MVALYYVFLVLEGLWGFAEGISGGQSGTEPPVTASPAIEAFTLVIFKLHPPVWISVMTVLAAYWNILKWVALVAIFAGFLVGTFFAFVFSTLYTAVSVGYALAAILGLISIIHLNRADAAL